MKSVFDNERFAVVDLETTGTQMENKHHIIQFGCAIIEHMKVVKTYSFMINPHREIPISVQNLTGITNQDVKHAKDFSYYAPKITQILKGATFVAHNVNFDFPFLNYELTNHNFEALDNRAIDTVELAKIAFPTLPSYKLSDLTSRLKIKHLDPHKADSDAYGTAILLIDIIKKLEKLPQATLNTLSSLSSGLVRNSSWIFTKIANCHRQSKHPLGKEYMQIRNLILQKQEDDKDVFPNKNYHFPKSDEKKRKLLHGHLNYRKAQIDLINHLHDFIENPDQRAMLVEAPNGTGKTFSYLFSYAYQLYSGRKLVIATPTQVLQEQILNREIPQLIAITHLDLRAEVVKSSSHYIDLDGFVQSLYQSNTNKPKLVLQMQILVWLTKTKTGDLDELQLTNYNAPLFKQITHPGDARVGSQFAKADFWNLARRRQEQADILITNHAYLANHYTDTIWGQNPYLVVDEAHRFKDNVIASRNDSLRFESLWGVISHLRNLFFFADEESIENQFTEDAEINYLLKKLDPDTLELINKINILQKYLFSHKNQAISSNTLANGDLELSFQGKELFPINNDFVKELLSFQKQLERVRQTINQIVFNLYNKQNSLLNNEEAILSEITEQIDHLDYYIEKSYQLADIVNNKNNLEQEGFIVIMTNPNDPLSTNLNWISIDATEELSQIFSTFDHILFVSATMTINNSFKYLIHELGIASLNPITYIGKGTFNLSRNLKAWAVTDMPQPNSSHYEKALKEIITSDITTKNHVLILMTNLDKIHDIFTEIIDNPNLKDFEILAQGITGSNNRIVKRFNIAKRAIILGADSFWEGVDFHKSGIDLVIATKLPFESPSRPAVKLRQQRLSDLNIDVFENDTIPHAIVRFKQGIGRLIRGERDRGQFVILDSRMWTASYGTEFIKAIPVNLQKITRKELKNKLNYYD